MNLLVLDIIRLLWKIWHAFWCVCGGGTCTSVPDMYLGVGLIRLVVMHGKQVFQFVFAANVYESSGYYLLLFWDRLCYVLKLPWTWNHPAPSLGCWDYMCMSLLPVPAPLHLANSSHWLCSHEPFKGVCSSVENNPNLSIRDGQWWWQVFMDSMTSLRVFYLYYFWNSAYV